MLPGADGSIFSPNSSDRNNTFNMDACDAGVSTRGTLSSGPLLFESFESSPPPFADTAGAVGLAGESSHREKLKLEVAREGMKRSDCPTSLRNRVVKDRRGVPDDDMVV